jgi:hypothetical protein
LLANRQNAQLSTGPRTEAGREKSSRNAVKSALTGRTVLLPTDDRDEYAQFLSEFEQDLQPIGQMERELVQIIVDCHWRLRRIQTLEYALYAHGEEQFNEAFPNCPQEERYPKILLQTHLTYEKQLRNLQIQEARIDRKSYKAMDELRRLQKDRSEQSPVHPAAGLPEDDPILQELRQLAALEGRMIPTSWAQHMEKAKEEDEKLKDLGFVFSNDEEAAPNTPEQEAA